MKRGDVYWAALKPRSSSEQTGRRPVILLSNDGFNSVTSWRSIIVVLDLARWFSLKMILVANLHPLF